MLSSSASWSTRSLKSSHESSRLKYSSVESSGGASSGAACRSSLSCVASPIVVSIPTSDRSRPELVDQPGAQRVGLQPLPLAQEVRVQHVAPRAQVCVERLEAAVEEAVRRLARYGGVEVLSVGTGGAAQGRGVVGAQAVHGLLHARHEFVAVVDLAEDVLKVLGVPRAPLGGRAERRGGH